VLTHTVFQWISQYGYAAIFGLLMLGIVGLPVPDETLLTFTGYLVFKQRLSLPLTLAAAYGGSITGISLSFLLGRSFGLRLVHRYGTVIHLTPERLEKVHQWFERKGRWTLTFGYFVPGVRHLTAYVAGASELDIFSFALFAYSGAFLWASTFITLGYFLGEQWERVGEEVHTWLLGLTVAVGLALAVFWFWRRRRASRKQ
jgi:membrane protein DedA with SNARE-associated domain